MVKIQYDVGQGWAYHDYLFVVLWWDAWVKWDGRGFIRLYTPQCPPWRRGLGAMMTSIGAGHVVLFCNTTPGRHAADSNRTVHDVNVAPISLLNICGKLLKAVCEHMYYWRRFRNIPSTAHLTIKNSTLYHCSPGEYVGFYILQDAVVVCIAQLLS